MVTKINVSFRLRGMSQFNLMLRSQNCANDEACLLRFVKEGYADDMKLFLLFGRLDVARSEFAFIKKCEVPLMPFSQEQTMSDYIDVRCKVVDMGNDEIQVKARANSEVK